MHAIIAIIAIYLVIHVLFYKRHRRHGFGVFYSARGPFHTWIRVSKRL